MCCLVLITLCAYAQQGYAFGSVCMYVCVYMYIYICVCVCVTPQKSLFCILPAINRRWGLSIACSQDLRRQKYRRYLHVVSDRLNDRSVPFY